MSKRIPLTWGQFAIVDDDDFGWLSKHKWLAMRDEKYGYVAVRIENGEVIHMDREVIKHYERE